MKVRLSNPILYCLLLLTLIFFTNPALADSDSNRLSLAISGGASKGAYEAGLTWGIVEVLRQVNHTQDGALGGDLRPVEISSIAGTSAGGINTLLAALVWSVKPENEGGFANRIGDNIFRDFWLSPDVNRLLPTKPDSPQYLPDDALLSRKDLVAVARELRKKWKQPGSFRSGVRVPMGVTVTRVRPDTMTISGVTVLNQRFFIPFEMHTQEDGSAAFVFKPEDYPSLIDPAMILMPRTAESDPFSISDQQIEDALLTTSAFPGGFGRKRLQYCRQKKLSAESDTAGGVSAEWGDANEDEMICPDGYELSEAEFADGGLFDNLPLGLSRLLAESSRRHKETHLPVRYIYLDPDRRRYASAASEAKRACEGDNPPDACRQMTFDLASEAVVLGGAIGTARKYELYRELTSDNWRLSLSQLSRNIADIVDANQPDMNCDAVLPFFEGQLPCGDRLRYAGRLLELARSYRLAPIVAPLSAQALLNAGIAETCRPSSAKDGQVNSIECRLDAQRLRKQLADGLIDLVEEVAPKDENLINDFRQSALSVDSDRHIYVTSRGGPITGTLLSDFGAFLDYKFREYDYHVGIYDAVIVATNEECARIFPALNQETEIQNCRDQLSEQLYQDVGVADDPKSRYLFALMAKQEFGKAGGLRYAYDPMPPEDRDTRIIFEGLSKSLEAASRSNERSGELISVEREFFEHLKTEGFEPTTSPDGGASLLSVIMDDPEYWSHELANRATSRMVHLEKEAQAIYQAREPDPQLQEEANTGLMGAGALALRTVTYQYPRFTFSPSTAPDDWIWRNIIPYETAFDTVDGDILFFWQPTWNFKRVNAGLRIGLGFSGGLVNSSADVDRENYGTVGLDLTRMEKMAFFSGWGITPAVYHSWKDPEIGDQTTFGLDVHANLLANRLRISLGARDIVNDANDTFFVTIGITDLPGIIYWLSR
ncbi:patatin-like phospholipase family protein [Desulfosarcina sp.]|uniref:patatin-like phospholipase family protein n=1 Tax=Desulfosarcina sp. TaxID=2027861 RepID=UPI0029A0405B|nr:patatin-like phospholipase family protein [Desulfosarcina sp.]MDX2453899.1 patatin-like phospholipase family protein [Desulfosarcina sp.]MDX2491600.1 patatin-like phospholipase family protein [Desulfosarcina sp.]